MGVIRNLVEGSLPAWSQWGYPLIFLMAVAEAIPIVGFFTPGLVIVVMGGFLARLGILNLYYVTGLAMIGVIAGDLIGYYIGQKYGYEFVSKYGKHFFFNQSNFNRTRSLLEKHAGKTLVIGKFNQITRSFGPFAAGTLHFNYGKFLFYNIIGGILWAITYSLLGFIFGHGILVATKWLGRFLVIAIILAIILSYVYNFLNTQKHIFAKYHIYALILCISSLAMYLKLIDAIVDYQKILLADEWVSENIRLIWNPFLNRIMILCATNIGLFLLTVVLLIFVLALVYKKRWYLATLLTSSFLFGYLSMSITKALVMRPRPGNSLIHLGSYSFPSAHAMSAFIFFAFFIYINKDSIKGFTKRCLFYAINMISILLVGFSRLYLNVHWLSDVIGGFLLGLFWISFMILVLKTIYFFFKYDIDRLKKRVEKKMHL